MVSRAVNSQAGALVTEQSWRHRGGTAPVDVARAVKGRAIQISALSPHLHRPAQFQPQVNLDTNLASFISYESQSNMDKLQFCWKLGVTRSLQHTEFFAHML